MAAFTPLIVGIGAAAGDKTGDGGRTAFIKVNDNFGVLFNAFTIDSTTFDVTFSGTLSGVLTLDNNTNFNIKNFAGTPIEVMRLNTSDQILIGGASTALFLKTGSANRVTINSLGAVFAGGITFSGDAAVAANLLDDYEEGTFTAAFSTATGSITVSSTADTLSYTKIGRLVTIQGSLEVSAISAPTGTLNITGLPFVALATLEQSDRGAIAVNLILPSSDVPGYVSGRILESTTQIVVTRSGIAATFQDMAGFIDTGSVISINGSYLTA